MNIHRDFTVEAKRIMSEVIQGEVDKVLESVNRALDSNRIPDRMYSGILGYVAEGRLPGDFLRAVISNDLMQAACRADSENIKILDDYARLLYNQFPTGSYGSADKMKAWNGAGGLKGMLESAALDMDLEDEVKGGD